MCYDVNIDIGGGGGGGGEGKDNVRGKENVLSPAGFPNFCHNFCPALSEKRKFKEWGNE